MTGTLYGDPGDRAVVVGLPSDFDLNQRLRSARAIYLATAFARESGWKIIKHAVVESSAEITIITGLYCCHTEPQLLREWLDLVPRKPGLSVNLASSPTTTKKQDAVFHPKVLIVCGDHGRFAIVGSGNLTSGGLRSNIECSIYTEEVAHVDSLLHWFDEIEKARLTEAAIREYEVRYDQSAKARKDLETAQQDAEQAIKRENEIWRRDEAIQAAKAHFRSKWFLDPGNQAKRNAIIPNMRKWLDYPDFHFSPEAWTEFYKKAGLGKIRIAYLSSTLENISKIQDGLRFLLADGEPIDEERLREVLRLDGKYHVNGIGINLVSKFLAAHDPKNWFVYNKQVDDALKSFGYQTEHGDKAGSYLAYVKEMRQFKGKTGAEDCVELDSFFGDWYDTHCKVKDKSAKGFDTPSVAFSSERYAEYVGAAKSAGLTADEFERAMTIWGNPGDERPPDGVVLLRRKIQAQLEKDKKG